MTLHDEIIFMHRKMFIFNPCKKLFGFYDATSKLLNDL